MWTWPLSVVRGGRIGGGTEGAARPGDRRTTGGPGRPEGSPGRRLGPSGRRAAGRRGRLSGAGGGAPALFDRGRDGRRRGRGARPRVVRVALAQAGRTPCDPGRPPGPGDRGRRGGRHWGAR